MNKILQTISEKSPHLSWIKDNALLVVKHGSMAYGTNISTSDEDFKGVAIPPKEYFFGSLKVFEQAELKDPDTVIYDIRKFFKLSIDNNPNLIETMHVDESDIMYISNLGIELLKHKNEFLSKRAKYSFAGYAIAQLKRIKTHRKYILNPPTKCPDRKDFGLKEAPLINGDQLAAITSVIQAELDKINFNFIDHLEEDVKFEIKHHMTSMLAEFKINKDQQWLACANKIGLDSNFIEILFKERQFFNAKKEWDQYVNWKNTRNSARFALEEKFKYDTKHALHLIRLLRMCKEIVQTGKVIVKRPDAQELLEIRNGLWSYDKLIEESEKLQKDIDAALPTSTLPNVADKVKLDNLCISLVEKSLSK